MDGRRFDDLTRSLSAGASRRRLLSRLASGLVLVLATGGTGSDAALAKKQRRTVKVEGPCGDGGPKANACDKDKDCCTRYCKTSIGRCRCKQLGAPCDDDRNCCATAGQPMTCQSGRCQTIQSDQAPLASPPPPDAPPPPPPPPPTACGACGPCQVCVGTTCQPCPGCCSGGVCVAFCPTCQACVGGQCVAANEGRICGTKSRGGGGRTRCCNGTCPDPSCLSGGTQPIPCGALNPPDACDGLNCCAQQGAVCDAPVGGGFCYCTFGSSSGDIGQPCGSDSDCGMFGSICQCGFCAACVVDCES